jgi:nucleoside-diphosphate-sugar epimerase
MKEANHERICFNFYNFLKWNYVLLTYTSAGDKDQYSTFINMCMVHVDDVARAHLFLLECPTTKGRYICSSDLLTIEQMSEFLSARYPEFQIPTPE